MVNLDTALIDALREISPWFPAILVTLSLATLAGDKCVFRGFYLALQAIDSQFSVTVVKYQRVPACRVANSMHAAFLVTPQLFGPRSNAGKTDQKSGFLSRTSTRGRQAKAWVRDVVVRLRLCPFAEAVFNAEKGVRYVVTPAVTTDEVWRDFLREVHYLMDHDRKVRFSSHRFRLLAAVVVFRAGRARVWAVFFFFQPLFRPFLVVERQPYRSLRRHG